MERRRFGLTPREVPVIGEDSRYLDDGRPVALAELRDALHLGMTRIDTAGVYGEAHQPAPYAF